MDCLIEWKMVYFSSRFSFWTSYKSINDFHWFHNRFNPNQTIFSMHIGDIMPCSLGFIVIAPIRCNRFSKRRKQRRNTRFLNRENTVAHGHRSLLLVMCLIETYGASGKYTSNKQNVVICSSRQLRCQRITFGPNVSGGKKHTQRKQSKN